MTGPGRPRRRSGSAWCAGPRPYTLNLVQKHHDDGTGKTKAQKRQRVMRRS